MKTMQLSQIARIRVAMEHENIGAMLLTNMDSIAWATGFTGSNAQIILTASEGLFITDSRYTIQAHEQVEDLAVVTQTFGTTLADFLADQIRRLGIETLSFEAGFVTVSIFDDWKKKFEGVELSPVTNLIGPLRCVKLPHEVEKIRAACKMADACMEHVIRMIQPGVAEWDIGLDIEFFFRRQGADLAFEPIVVSGERSSRPHGRASQKKLEIGDFITLDFGCQVEGYNSDITRTFVIGEVTERHERIYNQVLKANQAAIDAIRPGKTGKEIDQLARDVLAEVDMAQYMGHGLGHGLGRLVHDFGGLSQRSDTVLAPGMVMTVEPGVYIEGFGGVRIEDDVVVTETGAEVLTNFPKNLLVLS